MAEIEDEDGGVITDEDGSAIRDLLNEYSNAGAITPTGEPTRRATYRRKPTANI
jgi:hypothetical protein